MKLPKRMRAPSPSDPMQERRKRAELEFRSVVDSFAGKREVILGGSRGFGSGALKIKGKLFAMISSRAQFVVKLPAARVTELVASGLGTQFDPGHGRLMKEWLAVDGTFHRWRELASEAHRYVNGD